MLSMAYVSSARFGHSDGDLATLLMNSRANNARLGLTGILLHRNGRFLQVLEGHEQAVRAKYAIIASDPRHQDIQLLIEEFISARQFPSWTMGYHAVTDDLVSTIPGYDDFFEARQSEAHSAETATRALRLLDWFRDHSLSPIYAPTT